MKKILYNVIILLIICLNQNALAEPEENDFGIVNAWYNGQEATVKNIYLDVNEQAELKVEIIPKKDCDIYVKISNPMVTEAYRIKSGPSEYDSYFSNKNVKVHENLTFFWIIEPTGDWTNGNAPINVRVSFAERDIQMPIEFTIANPYILDEHYSGPAPTRTATDPSSTDQPPSQGSPGFGVAGALLGIALVMMARRN